MRSRYCASFAQVVRACVENTVLVENKQERNMNMKRKLGLYRVPRSLIKLSYESSGRATNNLLPYSKIRRV